MTRETAKKAIVGIVICACSIVGSGLGAASAGEIAGNGKRQQPIEGNSICQFSGQNDEYHEEPGDWPRVQSFGQEVRSFARLGLVDDFAHDEGGVGIPGTECNGHLNPWRRAS